RRGLCASQHLGSQYDITVLSPHYCTDGGRTLTLIIDIHGHYTTAPEPLGAWRDQQLAALAGDAVPPVDGPVVTDDQIRESIETNQLRLMNERGIDVQIFSPRASFMAH